jgi:hypothetical protein
MKGITYMGRCPAPLQGTHSASPRSKEAAVDPLRIIVIVLALALLVFLVIWLGGILSG